MSEPGARRLASPYLPAGAAVEDYAQTVWAGSLRWGWRHLEVNTELFFNRFETPIYEPGLDPRSYYLEAIYMFLPGWYAAGRYDAMRFDEVPSAAGAVTWDQNLERVELGVGYRISRELRAKAVGQLTDSGSGWDVKRLLPAVQLAFRF